MSLSTTHITQIIYNSLIEEVELTPKPGLVDLLSNGSHKDLNPTLFRDSAKALKPTFQLIADLGVNWKKPLDELFSPIRVLGLLGEKNMLGATNGVNTHKGALFSMGILSAVTGYAIRKELPLHPTNLCILASDMTKKDLIKDFEKMQKRKPKTHGEMLYHTQNHKGIRGEVMEGFPTIRNYVLPYLSECQGPLTLQDKLHILLLLMANLEDTNVLSRGGEAGLEYIQETAKNLLKEESSSKANYIEEQLEALDEEFIKRNLSSGGAADLLAVSLYLYEIQNMYSVNSNSHPLKAE